MSARALWLSTLLLTGCLDEPQGYTAGSLPPARMGFVDWTAESGLIAEHRLSRETVNEYLREASSSERELLPMASGIAIGDVDLDGWTDVLALVGQRGAVLFRNTLDGSFEDVTRSFELETDPLASGPLLADFDGDGLVDLLLGGIGDEHVKLYTNDGGVRFQDATLRSGLTSQAKVLAVSAGDADGDGDLDVLLAKNGASHEAGLERAESFWLNDGSGRFSDRSGLLSTPTLPAGARDAGVELEVAISPSFVDLDTDGDQDVALVQDQGLSLVFENLELDAGLPVFRRGSELDAPLGRGSALGDYDNDGDLDWFISGIDADGLAAFAPGDGNHLYENQGDGSFEDVTERAGVGDGSFAWGSCFADFDNDGHLDLFQVNGWGYLADGPDAGSLRHDASRLFHNQGNGTFEEVAHDVGIDDVGEGRAVACFDYDHDGDVDIVVNNAGGELTFWGNTLNPWYSTGADYLCVSLFEDQNVRTTVGARVRVQTGDLAQTRQVLLGSYVSQSSTELHFGLGSQELIDRIDIEWTDGDTGQVSGWDANNCLQATHLP